jgi:hypothetical protein
MLLNSCDFKIMKEGRDEKSDKRLLDWFQKERKRLNKEEIGQGVDGIFRIKKEDGTFEDL